MFHQKVPNIYFMCSGKSTGKKMDLLMDGALLQAGVGNTNLIRVSSILPPFCRAVEPFEIPQGSLLPIAYATLTSDKQDETISSAVAIAIPDDRSVAGVIMEHSGHHKLDVVEARVREMTEEAMRMRGITAYTIKSEGVEAVVDQITTTFAAVVLWWDEA